MMSTGTLILVLVLGVVFIVVVVFALFFWYRVRLMLERSDEDCVEDESFFRRFSRSISRNSNTNTQQHHAEQQVPLNTGTVDIEEAVVPPSNSIPENATISNISHGPPSYNDLKGSFVDNDDIGDDEMLPSYDEVHTIDTQVFNPSTVS